MPLLHRQAGLEGRVEDRRRRLADPAMLIEVELVVDLAGSPQGKPVLEKYNAENHGGDFYQGVIVNGGRLIYLAGQVANNPDNYVAGVGDLQRQAEKGGAGAL